jgi:DNA-binding CsgD family transcriptional regulator
MLTKREKQVVLLLAKGLSTDEIATELDCRHTTVRAHIRSIHLKLNTHNLHGLVGKVLMEGLA